VAGGTLCGAHVTANMVLIDGSVTVGPEIIAPFAN